MQRTHVIKARRYHGAKSLDLTIPTSICEEFDIVQGDAFALEVIKEPANGNERIVLKYEIIYSQKKGKKIL